MRKQSILLFSLFLLISLLFILPNPSDAASSAVSSQLLAQSRNRQCGQLCGGTHGTCDASLGLRCMRGPNVNSSSFCIPTGCTYANRTACCLALTPSPTGSKVPTGSPTGSVPVTGAVTPGPGLSTTPGTTAAVTAAPTSSVPVKGDCSGNVAGISDGKVDLFDVEQLRKELSKQITTLACDFDKNGAVDIIDFTDYLRLGFLQKP